MDHKSDKELLKTFEKLDLDLGKCSPNIIEAWFDTDSLQIKDFLIWLSRSLSKQNVIHAYEIEEYEDYVTREVIPHEQYEDTLKEISEKYPNIFNVEENEFEIEYLEDELDILLQDESELDNILQLHENLYKKEKILLTELEKQKIDSTINLEKLEEECLAMGSALDKINKKLYDQIINSSEKLLEYEYSSPSIYISNIPLNKYNNQHKEIISYFGLLDKKEFAGLPKLQSAVKTCSKLNGSVFCDKTNNKLNKLKQKLFKSIQNKNYKQTIKEELTAELTFLEQLSTYDLMDSLRSKSKIEVDIQLKSEYYDMLSLELENLTLEVSEKYIDFPSTVVMKQEATMFQKKLEGVKEVENIFTKIFSYHTLLYFMIIIDNIDISKLDQFFRSVHCYITHNLMNCKLRTESMNDIIANYKLYQQIPLEQRSMLLQVLLRLLSTDDTNTKLNIDALNIFLNNCHFENLSQLPKFREQTWLIENNNRIIKSFLTDGPTIEFVTISFKLYELFNKIDNILNIQNSIITTTVMIWKSTMEQISENDWFKFKRQLWMYFLMHPQKVLANIKKIEREIQKITVETI